MTAEPRNAGLAPYFPQYADVSGRARTVGYVIGAQKAGTTWLHAQLARHADVHTPPRKEIHYWSALRAPHDERWIAAARLGLRDAERHARSNWWKGGLFRTSYKKRLDRAAAWSRMFEARDARHRSYLEYLHVGYGGQRLVLDMTPTYALLHRSTLCEMATLPGEAWFVFILRDPVDRLWAGIKHRFRHTAPTGRPLDLQACRREFELAAAMPAHPDRRLSQYELTLMELDAAGLSSRALVLLYESLFEPKATARIAAHFGIAPFEADFATAVNRGVDTEVRPSDEAFVAARRALDATYHYVFDRFGAEVPEPWRR